MLGSILSLTILAVPAVDQSSVVQAQAHTPAPVATSQPHRPPPGYELVWSDEFDEGELPDPDKWAYDTHRNAKGWYNNELQYYAAARPENARIEDGHLIIEARREALAAQPEHGGQEYSSARLFTQGKAAWTYGFYEIRAKLPCTRGTWPAIWMLPEDETAVWPAGGEIDIMEHVGYEPGVVHHSVHAKMFNFERGTQRTTSHEVAAACSEFHRYQLLWRPDGLLFAVDDQPSFLFRNKMGGKARWPFDKPMHLILNIAVGGTWGGRKGIDEDRFPARMEIDYVRVYQTTQEGAE